MPSSSASSHRTSSVSRAQALRKGLAGISRVHSTTPSALGMPLATPSWKGSVSSRTRARAAPGNWPRLAARASRSQSRRSSRWAFACVTRRLDPGKGVGRIGSVARRARQYVSRCILPCAFIAAPTVSQDSPACLAMSCSASTTPSSIAFSPQT